MVTAGHSPLTRETDSPLPAKRAPPTCETGSPTLMGMPALELLELPPGPAGLARLVPPLRAALDGTGPAVGLVPAGASSAASAVRSALRADQPVAADTAVVVATSGSTGSPAGVELSRSALWAAADGLADLAGGGRGWRWLTGLPLHSVGGLMTVVRSLRAGEEPLAGGWLGGAQSFSAESFRTASAQLFADPVTGGGAGSAVSLVPAMLARLLVGDALEALRGYDLVLIGGSATPTGQLTAARAQGVRVVSSYGMTETCGGVVFDGVPVATAQVDAVAGRLRIAGPMVARGYRDGRAPERWGETPTGQPTFLTSDLGWLDNKGSVRVTGRMDDVVAVGGVNVSLGAIEGTLGARARAAAVVAVADQTWGARVVAFLVAPELPAAELAEAIRDQLGAAAVPREWRELAALPELSGGKIDRVTLRRWAALSSGAFAEERMDAG